MGDIHCIDENKPHEVSEVICVKCGKRWISVRPEGTLLKDIECPNCGAGFVIKTGQDLEVAENKEPQQIEVKEEQDAE